MMGLTSEVSNQSLDQVAINMNNFCRKRERAQGMDLIMALRENCTPLEITLPTQLYYYQDYVRMWVSD